MTERVPTAVLISGRGSNLRSLLAATSEPSYPADVRLVVSNRADAGGLRVATEHAVEAVIVAHADHPTREAHEQAIDAILRARGIELVVLAGFMRILSPWLVARWSGRMLNIHPSLLPELRGLHTHRRALQTGATRHGCSVHLVTEGLDEGPVLAQAEVPVRAGDTEDELSSRVLDAEHRLYPLALEQAARQLQAGAARVTASAPVRRLAFGAA